MSTTAKPKYMTIYGQGTGGIRHVANYGEPFALCGAVIAQGTRGHLIEERVPNCTACTMLKEGEEG